MSTRRNCGLQSEPSPSDENLSITHQWVRSKKENESPLIFSMSWKQRVAFSHALEALPSHGRGRGFNPYSAHQRCLFSIFDHHHCRPRQHRAERPKCQFLLLCHPQT